MYNALLHTHSGLRWLVLIFIVWALIQAFSGWSGKREYKKSDKMSALLALIFTHIQGLIGLILYFISPKVMFVEGVMNDTVSRFFTLEHILMMIIAAVLITIGYSKSKREADPLTKHKKTAIYYGIGLLIILAAIPWPFRELGAGWI